VIRKLELRKKFNIFNSNYMTFSMVSNTPIVRLLISKKVFVHLMKIIYVLLEIIL
jgi:hypothetical protein